MKKRITIRLNDAEIEFLEKIKREHGFDYSNIIRFCINFVMLFKNTKEFRKLVDRMPK